MKNKEIQSWQDNTALERFQMISPLIDESLDNAQKIKLRMEQAAKYEISPRSLYRYEQKYREKGFEGLKPLAREMGMSKKLPANFKEVLEQAIQLKRELPSRSVSKIIMTLELENWVKPGTLARSTLARWLQKSGFSKRQMRMYAQAEHSSSKRFCKPNRMMLIQADLKDGPKLPIGKNGTKKKVYLSSAIDDHSRFILSSRFYDNEQAAVVEDTMKTAILRWGKFDRCYFDNGKQYVAQQLNQTLSKLGIRVSHAPVRSGKSKGKIEKFHQVVDAFLAEAKIHKVRSLDELNRLWIIYLDEAYQTQPHSGIREYYESKGISIKDDISPQQEFNRDSRNLVYLDAGVVGEAFLHHEERLVDNGACISFSGRKYETKPVLIGCKVEIAYDPMNKETITIHYHGMEPFTATPLNIGSRCDKKSTLPAAMQSEIPLQSRLLAALEKKHTKKQVMFTDAISFVALTKKGGQNDV